MFFYYFFIFLFYFYFFYLNILGLECPCKIHGNIHAEESILLKILEWTFMVHGHGMDTQISILFFNEWIIRFGYCMDTSTRV